MANIVYIACSIDGFIADQNNKLEWLTSIPNESRTDFGFENFLNRIDGIIMGRNTFEMVISFPEWPYTKPVFVLSSTLKEIPGFLKGKCSIVNGNIQSIVSALHNCGINSIYVDGGKTIQSFLAEDLIDEMIITTASKLIGSGVPLFGVLRSLLNFKIVQTEQLNPYLTQTKYVRER